jgi:holo-[acyl-carrier protein] synthase
MVLGIGLDIIETARIARALSAHGERFEARVYTPGELHACDSRADRVQALAARFAAKEACLKALGTGWSQGLSFRQVEVVSAAAGRPEIRLHAAAAKRGRDLGVAAIHVSLSHQPGMAAAVVVLEGER